MADPKEMADLVAASFEALDRYEESLEAVDEGGERPPAPGDVYVLEATRELGVEWAVVARDPAAASRFLVVPADGHVLAGSADVELEDDSPVGALKLRCRFGTWTAARLLRPELRVGVLGTEALSQARRRWLDVGDDEVTGDVLRREVHDDLVRDAQPRTRELAFGYDEVTPRKRRGLDVGDGEVTGDVLGREVDDDPGYQDWVDGTLVAARRALIEAQGLEQVPEPASPVEESQEEPAAPPARRPQGSMFLRIAASIIVAVASVQLWRLNERVQDLETASRRAAERHGVAVQQLESEQDRLVAERDRLQARQRELEETGAASEQEARELRQRVADLDRRLVEAERAPEVVNPAVAFFSPPKEARRGRVEVTLRPEQSHVIVFLELREPSPAPRYRLEVRVKGADAVIWTNDRLVVQEPGEIHVGLPVRILKQGEYELELLAPEGGTWRRVGEYELVVLASSDTPKG